MNWMYIALAALAIALIVSVYRWLMRPSERQMNPVGYSLVSDQEEEEIELSLRDGIKDGPIVVADPNKPTRKPQRERRQASRPRSKP